MKYSVVKSSDSGKRLSLVRGPAMVRFSFNETAVSKLSMFEWWAMLLTSFQAKWLAC